MIDLIILATLLHSPKHGYQLKREAGVILGQDSLHNNLIYPLLRRFTSDGWVTKKAVPGQRGQTRQQYAITPLGKKTLHHRLSDYSEQDARSLEAFIVRVGMFELLEPGAREPILLLRDSYLQQRHHQLATIQEKMTPGIFGGEVLRHLLEQIQSERNWIRRLRRIKKT
jgi:DNA-binding PadR family transcriptional regulator